MFYAAADTHAIIWYLEKSSRLSDTANNTIQTAIQNQQYIAISSITLAEMVYLTEKNRINPQALNDLLQALDSTDHLSVFKEIPINRSIVSAMQNVERDKVPDLPDRLIAATAVYLDVPLISRDSKIRVSGIQTIW